MRIATHPEAIKHLVKIGMAADISEHIKMVESANESLTEENARLKAECQARQAENSVLAVECDSLKAEVERLTKAGDNLEQVLTEISYSYRAGNASHEWRAAKGGKQP